MKLVTLLCTVLVGLLVSQGSVVAKVDCDFDNEALRSMPSSTLTVTRSDNTVFEVQVRTANSNKNRAAGFQRVCAETIAATPILFLFDKPRTPSFHMFNVVASIDIAFIRVDGTTDSIQKMQPYNLVLIEKPLYSSDGPVIGALEAHPGFFSENNIDLKSVLSWTLN